MYAVTGDSACQINCLFVLPSCTIQRKYIQFILVLLKIQPSHRHRHPALYCTSCQAENSLKVIWKFLFFPFKVFHVGVRVFSQLQKICNEVRCRIKISYIDDGKGIRDEFVDVWSADIDWKSPCFKSFVYLFSDITIFIRIFWSKNKIISSSYPEFAVSRSLSMNCIWLIFVMFAVPI